MIYNEEGVIWVKCDNCCLTMFGGFACDSRDDVINPMKRQGWTFGNRALCPYCTRDEGWIHRVMADIRRGDIDW